MGWDGMGYTLKSKQFYNGWMGDWTGLDTPFQTVMTTRALAVLIGILIYHKTNVKVNIDMT